MSRTLKKHRAVTNPEEHAQLPFDRRCSTCRELRLQGQLPDVAPLPPKVQAGITAGVLAVSTLAPAATAAAQGPPAAAGGGAGQQPQPNPGNPGPQQQQGQQQAPQQGPAQQAVQGVTDTAKKVVGQASGVREGPALTPPAQQAPKAPEAPKLAKPQGPPVQQAPQRQAAPAPEPEPQVVRTPPQVERQAPERQVTRQQAPQREQAEPQRDQAPEPVQRNVAPMPEPKPPAPTTPTPPPATPPPASVPPAAVAPKAAEPAQQRVQSERQPERAPTRELRAAVPEDQGPVGKDGPSSTQTPPAVPDQEDQGQAQRDYAERAQGHQEEAGPAAPAVGERAIAAAAKGKPDQDQDRAVKADREALADAGDAKPSGANASKDEREATPAKAKSETKPAATQDDRAGGSHTVAQGESLWSIAESKLGPGATNTQITTMVQQLWDLNSDRIATGDPNLIMPGQKLVMPEGGGGS